jgi:hypothetical protein
MPQYNPSGPWPALREHWLASQPCEISAAHLPGTYAWPFGAPDHAPYRYFAASSFVKGWWCMVSPRKNINVGVQYVAPRDKMQG